MRTHLECKTCGSPQGLTEYAENSYCFSCGESIFYGKRKADFQKYYPIWEDNMGNTDIKLPDSIDLNFNNRAQKWLLQNGITPSLVNLYKIGFVRDEIVAVPGTTWTVHLKNRIIFPYYNEFGLLFYQARSTDPTEKVKYYTIGNKSFYWSLRHPSNTLVITEDIASTIRTGVYCTSVALCGTKFTNEFLLTISKKYEKIIVWMDNDIAGKRAARELMKRLRLTTDNVVLIRSRKEAKQCHDGELKRILGPHIVPTTR